MTKESSNQYKRFLRIVGTVLLTSIAVISGLMGIHSYMTSPSADEIAEITANKILEELEKNPPDNFKKVIEDLMPQFDKQFHAINELQNKERARIPKSKEINEETVRLIKTRAENGDIQAQLALGGMYLIGLGVPQNDNEARKWYGKAAKQGNADAKNTLGWMFLDTKTSSETKPPDEYKASAVYIGVVNGSPSSFMLKRNGKKLLVMPLQRLQDGDEIFILEVRDRSGVENTITLALDDGTLLTLRYADTPYLVKSNNIHPTLMKNVFKTIKTWYSVLWNIQVNQAEIATR